MGLIGHADRDGCAAQVDVAIPRLHERSRRSAHDQRTGAVEVAVGRHREVGRARGGRQPVQVDVARVGHGEVADQGAGGVDHRRIGIVDVDADPELAARLDPGGIGQLDRGHAVAQGVVGRQRDVTVRRDAAGDVDQRLVEGHARLGRGDTEIAQNAEVARGGLVDAQRGDVAAADVTIRETHVALARLDGQVVGATDVAAEGDVTVSGDGVDVDVLDQHRVLRRGKADRAVDRDVARELRRVRRDGQLGRLPAHADSIQLDRALRRVQGQRRCPVDIVPEADVTRGRGDRGCGVQARVRVEPARVKRTKYRLSTGVDFQPEATVIRRPEHDRAHGVLDVVVQDDVTRVGRKRHRATEHLLANGQVLAARAVGVGLEEDLAGRGGDDTVGGQGTGRTHHQVRIAGDVAARRNRRRTDVGAEQRVDGRPVVLRERVVRNQHHVPAIGADLLRVDGGAVIERDVAGRDRNAVQTRQAHGADADIIGDIDNDPAARGDGRLRIVIHGETRGVDGDVADTCGRQVPATSPAGAQLHVRGRLQSDVAINGGQRHIPRRVNNYIIARAEA